MRWIHFYKIYIRKYAIKVAIPAKMYTGGANMLEIKFIKNTDNLSKIVAF